MDAGVAQVAEVGVKVRALDGVRHLAVSRAGRVGEHGGQENERVDGESPDEHPEHVDVSDDTEAELRDRVRIDDAAIDGVLLLFHLLLNDFLAIDLDRLVLKTSIWLNIVIRVRTLLVTRDCTDPWEGFADVSICERMQLFQLFVSILNLRSIKQKTCKRRFK